MWSANKRSFLIHVPLTPFLYFIALAKVSTVRLNRSTGSSLAMFLILGDSLHSSIIKCGVNCGFVVGALNQVEEVPFYS